MASKPISGQTLGHYRLLDRIGVGAMGVVYRAQDQHLHREVALKLLPPSVLPDESARRHFRTEAITLARLNHPNVATLYGFETDGDVDFLVMEYVAGVTLANKLARGPLGESDLLEYGLQLVSALEDAHEHGVIHRDLKPANILITAEGHLKILDFGLARLLSPEEGSGTVSDGLTIAGTLPYIAPEQLSGAQPADNLSDLYSCGVVLYEMATGRPPHKETSVPALLAAILNREPASVRSLNPAISPELEAIIRRAMDKNPACRYQSAHELKIVLQSLVSGRRLGVLPEAPKPFKRRRLSILFVVLLALAVSFAILGIRWKSTQAPVPAPPRVVAVLPFEPVGGTKDSQILCRGLTDLLTTRLTQISKQYGVEVVPASEVRSQGVNSVGIARQKLGVNLVVEGSWDFAAHRVMYSLVNAERRRSVSAESVTADVKDLLSMEHQVSDGLLKMVAGELRPTELNSPIADSLPRPDAYQYYVRGVGYLQDYQDANSLEAAATLFHSALERDPAFAPALAGAGEAYWRLYQETKDQIWIPKAIEACRRAADLNNNLPAVHVTLGLISQGQGKFDEAAKEFQRALVLDPTSDAAYRGLANSYEALGKTVDAERAYRQAIDVRRDYWGGYSALGAFYAKMARYDDAAAAFRRVIELAPENVRGYSNLGAVLLLQGKTQQAEDALQKSLTIEPSYRAYSNLATLYFSQMRFSDSARMFEKALQLNDRDARVWRNLGDAYYWSPDERKKAEGAYRRAAELLTSQRKIDPQDTELMAELALCDIMLGKQEEAVALVQEAHKRSPSDPDVLFRMAEIFEQAGEHSKAIDSLGLAIRNGYSIADIEHDPTLQGLRSDPRYKQLVENMSAKPSVK